MPDLFKEIIPSILQTGKSVFEDEASYKDYVPFVVNRALSYHIDCVLHANEMNKIPSTDKDMQYQYLLNSTRQMKRKFQPWQKPTADKDIEFVKEYFGYNNQRAKEAMAILTKEQIAEIRRRTDKGGMK
jgi:hypothetical protein